MSTKQTDAGPPAATPAPPALTFRLTCEVCDEELLVAPPKAAVRYGAIDCPACGTAYLILLEPRGGRGPRPATSAA